MSSWLARFLGKRGVHFAWAIFLGCCCMMAGGLGVVLNSSGVFYVAVCDELGFNRGELAVYLSFYLVSMVIATPIVGNLLPRVNIRILMSVMCVLVCLAEALMSTYTALWQWYASGIVFGLCGTFIFILPTPLMIGNWFKKHTGLILGIAMSFSGVGTALFSQLFTYLIGTVGWRSTYVVAACCIAVLILPFTLFVFRFRPADMGLLPYGDQGEAGDEKKASDPSHAAGVAVKAAVLSVPFICIFILSGFEEYFGGISNQIASFADSIGKTAQVGATLLSIISVGNIVIKIAVGWLIDRIGIIRAVHLQMLICAIGCAVFALTRETWILYVGAFFLGVQNSVVTVSEPMLVRHFFGERSYAQVYSYIRIAAGLFGSFGMPIVGFIYDFTGSYEPAFILGIVIAVFLSGLVLVASTFKKKLPWEEGDDAK